ncbi:MAG: MscL family protein, partial [Candidatus Methanoperedens sp.]|nr:MscL family protein [Candidatus Methanoperedens sp.]
MVEEKKSFMQEFIDFLNKYGVIGLAVAFVIGAAVTKLVSALVTDLIMPIIAALIPGGDWRAATLNIGGIRFLVGDFVGEFLDYALLLAAIGTIAMALLELIKS